MNVEIGSEHYSASETMLPVADIDSLGVVLDEDELDEPEVPGRFYEVTFFASELQDRKDQYSLNSIETIPLSKTSQQISISLMMSS